MFWYRMGIFQIYNCGSRHDKKRFSLTIDIVENIIYWIFFHDCDVKQKINYCGKEMKYSAGFSLGVLISSIDTPYVQRRVAFYLTAMTFLFSSFNNILARDWYNDVYNVLSWLAFVDLFLHYAWVLINVPCAQSQSFEEVNFNFICNLL